MGLDISRRSFLKAAAGLAVIAVVKPVKLVDLFDEVAPEAKGKSTVSMWVKPADPTAILAPNSYFQGSIFKLRISDRLLTDKELLAIYQHEKKFFESFEAESLGIESSDWRHVTRYSDGIQINIGPAETGEVGATWAQLPNGLWVLDFDGKQDYLTT